MEPTPVVGDIIVSGIKEWVGLVMIIIAMMSGLAAFIKVLRMDKHSVRKEKNSADYAEIDSKKKKLDYTQELETVLDELRSDILDLQSDNKKLKSDYQDVLRTQAAQNIIIERQSRRISFLECQITNYQTLINALMAQVRKHDDIPVEMEDLQITNCEEETIE
jgi:uncharacterized membrane-anchored protein YhcB (DUF1043 family)